MASAPAALKPRRLTPDLPIAGQAGERKLKPVKWLAAVGALVLIVMAWAYAWWFTSGDFGPSPAGPTEIPTNQIVAARFWEAVGVIGALLAIWFFIVKPWRKTGQLGLDGMFVIIFFQLWAFQDAFCNYIVNQFQYNAAFVDFGSWYSYIPGWMSPNGSNLAEPVLFAGGLYIWLFASGLLVLNWLMRKAKARWPRMGKLGVIGVVICAAAIVDLVFEVLWLRQGLYAYGGHVDELTLFPDHYYAFPVYEAVCWGICWGLYAAIRFYKDDKGQIVTEKGISEMKVSRKRRQWLRFLSLLGAANLIMIAFYQLPYQAFGLWADSIPEEVTERSYMTTGVCGIGTEYACTPNDAIPFTVKGSQAHFTPTGKIVEPSKVPVEPAAKGAPPVEGTGRGWP